MTTLARGAAIEAESFRIIEKELGEHNFGELEFPLVRRVIHATADFDLGKSLHFSSGSVEAGMEAIRMGVSIVTDISMVASGISRSALQEAGGGEIRCRIVDPGIWTEAKAKGLTRSAAAIRSFGKELGRSVVVIGNAPTALREVLRLAREEQVRPLLVIGVPVGFVDAAESKGALADSDLTCITNRGRKGGTPTAVALVNALIHLVLQERRSLS
jgi:precorrin-8X/cobalt-precorrin-8 methylmutase